jgi:hypothetical protein
MNRRHMLLLLLLLLTALPAPSHAQSLTGLAGALK